MAGTDFSLEIIFIDFDDAMRQALHILAFVKHTIHYFPLLH